MAGPRRERNPFLSVKIGEGAGEHFIGLKPEQFTLLAQASGGCRVVKGGNEKALGVLHRMGLVRFHFGQDHDWPVAMAILTPAGAQALAQEPLTHAAGTA